MQTPAPSLGGFYSVSKAKPPPTRASEYGKQDGPLADFITANLMEYRLAI
jgi:hypothetical protein